MDYLRGYGAGAQILHGAAHRLSNAPNPPASANYRGDGAERAQQLGAGYLPSGAGRYEGITEYREERAAARCMPTIFLEP